MKKTTKRKLIVAAVGLLTALVVAALVWAFSGKKDSYCSVIPDDAVALARVDIHQFFSEHDIDLKDQKNLSLALVAQMANKSGVDFSKPIYAFACENGKAGIVVPISDVELFRDFMKNNGFMSFTLSQSKGYDWAMSGQIAAIFDSEKCLLMTGVGMNVRRELIKLMEQDEDDSVLDESLYANISRCKKPLAAIVSVEEMYKQNIPTLTEQMGVDDDAFDMDVLFSFDAKKEKATLALDVFPNSSEARQLLKEKMNLANDLKGKFINAIDTDPVLWLSFSGMQNLGEQIAKLAQLDELSDLSTINLPELLGSFSGEAAVIVPNGSAKDYIFLAEVKDNKVLGIFNTMKEASQGQISAVQMAENEYFCSVAGQSIFAGIKNDVFYLTNAQNLVAKVGQNLNSNVSDYDDDITSASAYMNISAQQALQSALKLDPSLNTIMLLMGTRLSKLDRLYFTAKDTHAELVLKAKDGEDIVESLLK